MPYRKYVFRKLLRKAFCFVMLIPVFSMNLVLKLAQILCSVILLPVGLVAGAAGLIYMLSTKAFDETAASLVVLCLIVVLIKHFLPSITMYLDELSICLSYDLRQPVIPKPPVRYRYN